MSKSQYAIIKPLVQGSSDEALFSDWATLYQHVVSCNRATLYISENERLVAIKVLMRAVHTLHHKKCLVTGSEKDAQYFFLNSAPILPVNRKMGDNLLYRIGQHLDLKAGEETRARDFYEEGAYLDLPRSCVWRMMIASIEVIKTLAENPATQEVLRACPLSLDPDLIVTKDDITALELFGTLGDLQYADDAHLEQYEAAVGKAGKQLERQIEQDVKSKVDQEDRENKIEDLVKRTQLMLMSKEEGNAAERTAPAVTRAERRQQVKEAKKKQKKNQGGGPANAGSRSSTITPDERLRTRLALEAGLHPDQIVIPGRAGPSHSNGREEHDLAHHNGHPLLSGRLNRRMGQIYGMTRAAFSSRHHDHADW